MCNKLPNLAIDHRDQNMYFYLKFIEYENRRIRYAVHLNLPQISMPALGVDVHRALGILEGFEISLHCWQADDVGGFETPDATLAGGGIAVTGNYPGKPGPLLR